MGTIHKPTKKVWQGILVLWRDKPGNLNHLEQKQIDSVLRAVQWAVKMEILNGKK